MLVIEWFVNIYKHNCIYKSASEINSNIYILIARISVDI